MNFFEKIAEKISNIDKKQLFIVLLIFLVAFGLRAHLMKYGLFFEFDSYYHARMNSYVIQTGTAPERDPLTYYQLGGAWLPTIGMFFWQLNALFYKIFTLGAAYNKDLWIWFVKILPALYGAITAVLMFFLGKEILGKKAGYAMGFIAAVVPAFVYRTMAGFFEPTSFGFMWFVAGGIFLAKSSKSLEFDKKTIFYAILSGLLFGIMSFAYSGFLLVPIILVLFFAIAFFTVFGKNSFDKLLNFVKIFIIVFALFAIIASISSNFSWLSAALNWLSNVAPMNVLIFLGSGIAVVLGFLLYVLLASKKKSKESAEETKKTVKLIAVISMYAFLLAMLAFFLLVPKLFEGGFFGRSVGEENTGKQFFANKYNALIFFPITALLLIPYRIWRKKDETGHLGIFLFFWMFATLFMAWYKLKFTFTFGLPVAVGAGVVIAELFHFFETENKNEKYAFAGILALGTFLGIATNDATMAFQISALLAALLVFYFVLSNYPSFRKLLVAGFFGLMFLTAIAAGTYFVKDNVPNIESTGGWKEAFSWIKDSTPVDSKFFNWWDEGHWLAFMGERKTFIDNRNLDFIGSSDFSKFVISADLNQPISIMKKYGPNYVILSNDMFFKEGSFAVYAFETDDPNDERLNGYFGVTFYCNQQQTEKGIEYNCGSNRFSAEQMDSMYTVWNNIPNQLQGGRIPFFIYKSRSNSQVFLLNEKVNNSMLARLWFNQPESMKYFEESYANEGVKIFKVK